MDDRFIVETNVQEEYKAKQQNVMYNKDYKTSVTRRSKTIVSPSGTVRIIHTYCHTIPLNKCIETKRKTSFICVTQCNVLVSIDMKYRLARLLVLAFQNCLDKRWDFGRDSGFVGVDYQLGA